MLRLVITPSFRRDTGQILDYLEEVAGARVAATFSARFDETVVRLTSFPESGAPRRGLGTHTRIAIVQPYLLIYDFTPRDETLTCFAFSMAGETSRVDFSVVEAAVWHGKTAPARVDSGPGRPRLSVFRGERRQALRDRDGAVTL